MPKPPCDPIASANAAWLRMMADAEYASWWCERMRRLIAICEWPDRTAELRAELLILLKEVEAVE